MRRNLIRTILLATALAAAAPAAPLGAQRSTTERDAERQARDRERERMRVDVERARDDAHRAARDELNAVRESEGGGVTLDTTVTLGQNGVVDLSLVSGDVVVTGWTKGEARVHATTEHGRLRFEHGAGRLTLDVGSSYGRAGEARYELTVPEGTRVLMRSTSGDLSAHGVKGEVEARSTSGDVSVSDATGRIAVETVSGDVTLARLAGDVHGSSVSGDVQIDGIAGDVEYGSVSGDLSLRGARSRSVHLSAVSGDLTYEGTLDAAGRYEFGTHSGEVSLRLPADANASVSVQTFSGELESDFPITLQPGGEGARRATRRMEFTLGRGGPRLTAETFSGNITLERGTSRGGNR